MDSVIAPCVFVSLSVLGTVTNLACIVIVIYGGIYRQSRFIFFLKFLVCNLSMCAIGLPLWALMMLSSAAMESSILCSLHGYFMFSIGGTSLLNIGILSVNYYFCVVKYTLYDRVYTTRNICILLCVVWLIWPIFLLFPLLYPPQTKLRGYIVILMSVRSFVRLSVRPSVRPLPVSNPLLL